MIVFTYFLSLSIFFVLFLCYWPGYLCYSHVLVDALTSTLCSSPCIATEMYHLLFLRACIGTFYNEVYQRRFESFNVFDSTFSTNDFFAQ